MKRLKRDFPQVRICLLFDALYAAVPVFTLCDQNKWKYIITFKEGARPEVWKEYVTLKKLQPENAAERLEGELVQRFRWVTDTGYRGPCFDVLQCNESKPGKNAEIEAAKHLRFQIRLRGPD